MDLPTVPVPAPSSHPLQVCYAHTSIRGIARSGNKGPQHLTLRLDSQLARDDTGRQQMLLGSQHVGCKLRVCLLCVCACVGTAGWVDTRSIDIGVAYRHEERSFMPIAIGI
jgi:hypothetical protein